MKDKLKINKNLEIDINDYLSKEEIKEIIKKEVGHSVSIQLRDENKLTRILSNISYQIIFDEIDKILPNYKEKLKDNVFQHITSANYPFYIFQDRTPYSKPSLATQYLEEVIEDNEDLIKQTVLGTILNKDHSEKIWNQWEQMASDFSENIFELARMAKEKKVEND